MSLVIKYDIPKKDSHYYFMAAGYFHTFFSIFKKELFLKTLITGDVVMISKYLLLLSK